MKLDYKACSEDHMMIVSKQTPFLARHPNLSLWCYGIAQQISYIWGRRLMRFKNVTWASPCLEEVQVGCKLSSSPNPLQKLSRPEVKPRAWTGVPQFPHVYL